MFWYFFDDILVYSRTLEDHSTHLALVFELMKVNQIFSKLSKCVFSTDKVEYLGHYISASGVQKDPHKINAIQSWPIPVTVKELKGFLGLAGYYRKFVKGYAMVSKPLTYLLKKGNFVWSDQAKLAFETLKSALVTAHVLVVPNFDKQFIVETDASQKGIGAVIMQEGHPLAFISRSLGPKWQQLSLYENELPAIFFAVQKWEKHLMGNHFLIRTDQKSLKLLLQQKIFTHFQQFWLSKLMGFDYEIQYKSGKENITADALSRVQGAEVLLIALSMVDSNLSALILASYQLDDHLKSVLHSLTEVQLVEGFHLQNGLIRRKSRIVVGPDADLRSKIICWKHATHESGHGGRELTLNRVKAFFTWKGLTRDVRSFVRNCVTCQASKYDTSAYPGLL